MFKILGSDGKEYGPVTRGNVIEWIRDGRANLETKARRSDETEWKTLADFPEFVPTGTTPAFVPPSLTEYTAPAFPVPDTQAAARPLAGLRRRFAAALIDGLLQWICWMPAATALSTALTAHLAQGGTPSLESLMKMSADALPKSLPYLAVLAVVQIILLCRRSQSVGKIFLRIQIINVRDEQPGGTVRAFLLRGLPTWIIKQIPLLGPLFWLVDSFTIFREDQRCLHDLIAGTKVVKLK